ncbi:hypothetical protein EV1_004922 [Malus domestica]
MVGPIVEGAKALLKSGTGVALSHVRRYANRVAHRLTKISLQVDDYVYIYKLMELPIVSPKLLFRLMTMFISTRLHYNIAIKKLINNVIQNEKETTKINEINTQPSNVL